MPVYWRFLHWLDKKRSERESYTELIEHFETTSANVKSKTNALRAQLGEGEWQKNQTPRVIRLPVSNISASRDLRPVLIFMTCSGFSEK